jgi:HSP20 family molecular chaperone IbpA
VQAKLELGVLTLALPKAPEALPRQIPIPIA